LDQATGLINLRARLYDSSTGRFLSEDPAGFHDSLSPYVYVASNPLSATDPTGQLALKVGLDGSIEGAVGTAVGHLGIEGGVLLDISNPLRSRIYVQPYAGGGKGLERLTKPIIENAITD
jgi:uncharacterized protein RhaS with RHS repeats